MLPRLRSGDDATLERLPRVATMASICPQTGTDQGRGELADDLDDRSPLHRGFWAPVERRTRSPTTWTRNDHDHNWQ